MWFSVVYVALIGFYSRAVLAIEIEIITLY